MYNRFRYYNPSLGAYNAQDPSGLVPRLASAQGYVGHAGCWVDPLGLMAHPKWEPMEVLGKVVYQQTGTHVFDPEMVVNLPRSLGGGKGTNLDLMHAGRVPIGTDHKPVNLRHIGQDNRSALVELTQSRHTTSQRQLHIFHGLSGEGFPNDIIPVERQAFDEWRSDYWIEREKRVND